MKRIFTPAVKNLLISIILLVVISSVFYILAEGWSIVDSYYFTILTITTVGHAGLTPTTAATKIFTSFVAFVGIAMVLTLFGILSSHYVRIISGMNHDKHRHHENASNKKLKIK